MIKPLALGDVLKSFKTSSQCQDTRFISYHIGYKGLANGDGPCLIKHHGLNLLNFLKNCSIFNQHPILALRPVPTIRAVGVAKPRAHGQAIMRDRDCIEHGLLERRAQKHWTKPRKSQWPKSSPLEQRYLEILSVKS